MAPLNWLERRIEPRARDWDAPAVTSACTRYRPSKIDGLPDAETAALLDGAMETRYAAKGAVACTEKLAGTVPAVRTWFLPGKEGTR